MSWKKKNLTYKHGNNRIVIHINNGLHIQMMYVLYFTFKILVHPSFIKMDPLNQEKERNQQNPSILAYSDVLHTTPKQSRTEGKQE